MNFAATSTRAKVLTKTISVDQITGNAVLTFADFGGCAIGGCIAFNAAGAAGSPYNLLTTTGAVAAGATKIEWLQIFGQIDIGSNMMQGADVTNLVFTSPAVTLTFDLLNVFGITEIFILYFQVE